MVPICVGFGASEDHSLLMVSLSHRHLGGHHSLFGHIIRHSGRREHSFESSSYHFLFMYSALRRSRHEPVLFCWEASQYHLGEHLCTCGWEKQCVLRYTGIDVEEMQESEVIK